MPLVEQARKFAENHGRRPPDDVPSNVKIRKPYWVSGAFPRHPAQAADVLKVIQRHFQERFHLFRVQEKLRPLVGHRDVGVYNEVTDGYPEGRKCPHDADTVGADAESVAASTAVT